MEWATTVEGWAAIAAWVAAIVALGSTAITVWMQVRSRACAEWAPMIVGLDARVQENIMALRRTTPPTWAFELTNAGDGAAFDVSVTVDGVAQDILEIVEPAARAALRNIEGAVTAGSRLRAVAPVTWRPGGATSTEIVVRWTASPTRLGRRWEQTFRLDRSGFEPRLPARRAKS
ncbi:MAG: hypothetical protein QM708_12185 [Propioniciclava sp.]|uniref:hypothetical protein n=1 Tax=Propioniciclava sp. TaxID=2038686 RepID=UPI0039E28628